MKMKREGLFDERNDEIKMKHMSLIKMLQGAAAKKPQTSMPPYLSNDLMSAVFLLLPVKSLLRLACVSKAWYKIINCAEFVEAYNARADLTPIICRFERVDEDIPNTFHVETQLNKQSENFGFFPSSSGVNETKFIHFLEIENDKCKLTESNISLSGLVVATYNGLILVTYVDRLYRMMHLDFAVDQPLVDSQNLGRLIVMNPMTRKLIGFPLGTLPSELFNESYGLTFSQAKGVYKVVHLFKDNFGCFSCEVLSFETRSWKAIDGPLSELFTILGLQAPISTVGALHWPPGMPSYDYIITMVVDDERFSKTVLPTTMAFCDRLVEVGGFLSFVNNLDKDQIIDVWVLKALEGPEWVKKYTIRTDVIFILAFVDNRDYAAPAFAVNDKEMVFRRRDRLYLYSFELEEIREIKMENGSIMEYDTVMPHYNNLATWESLEPIS